MSSTNTMDFLPSSCLNLLRSGYCPPPIERSKLDGYILRKEDELASVSDEVIQAQEKLRQLTEKKTQLEQSIMNHRSLLAPIRRLSPELLSEIFLHCLTYNNRSIVDGHPGFVQPSLREAPLLLLRVSAAWNRIALSTPRLWTNIIIGSLVPSDAWNAWISRSGTLPLDIRIVSKTWSTTSSIQPTASLLVDTLCGRLRHLEIYTNDSSRRPLFVYPVDMPVLESFRIHLGDSGINSTSMFIPFASAPRLHRCSFYGLQRLSEHTSFPWLQLTYLRLHGQANMLDVLRRCTNLVDLELYRGSLYSGDLPASSRPVLLPHLSKLAWCVDEPGPGPACLDLPSLRYLEVTISSSEDPMSLLQQFGGQLEWLSLVKTDYLSRKELEECLVFLPQLRHLRIRHDDILRILSRSEAGTERRLVPRLQSIHIEGRARLVDLIGFIKARWNGTQTDSESVREIYGVALWRFDEPSVEQLRILKRCVDEGLVLRDDMRDAYTKWPWVLSGDDRVQRVHDPDDQQRQTRVQPRADDILIFTDRRGMTRRRLWGVEDW